MVLCDTIRGKPGIRECRQEHISHENVYFQKHLTFCFNFKMLSDMTFLKQQLICSLSQRTRCSNLSLKRKTNLHLPFLTFWKRWKSADFFCSTFKKMCKIFLKIAKMQRKQWWEKKLWTIKIKKFVFWQCIVKRTFFFSFLFRRTDVRGCIGWTFIYRYDQCLKKRQTQPFLIHFIGCGSWIM